MFLLYIHSVFLFFCKQWNGSLRPFLKSLNEIYLRFFGMKIWILDRSVNNKSNNNNSLINISFIMNTRLESCAKTRENIRGRLPEVFCKEDVLKHLTKFTKRDSGTRFVSYPLESLEKVQKQLPKGVL